MSLELWHLLLRGTTDLCLAAAALGCGYLLIATLLIHRFARARASAERSQSYRPATVTILKPLHGDEPGLLGRLAGFCAQNYDGPIQVVCGCQDRGDPAIAVVKQLKAALPAQAIDLVVDARSHGRNRKLSNLINMAQAACHDVMVLADSDIEVKPDYLAQIVMALQKPGVGAVTCLYHGVAGERLAGGLSATAINSHFLPNVLVAIAFGLARPCFGATIAMRRKVLTRIGGLHAFSDYLADDHAIGEAVRAVGLSVAMPSFSVGHICHERSLGEFFGHQLRAARTIRSIDPIGYVGAIICNPLPLALIGTLSPGFDGVALAVTALICRVGLCRAIERGFDLPPQPYGLLPATDVFLFVVYVVSFFGSAVTWRGHRYQVQPDGILSPERTEFGQNANAVPPGPFV